MTPGGLQERRIGDVIILTIQQGLKGALETMLKERIGDLVREGCLQIVVDLQRIPYMDSSEIGRLIRSHLSVRQAGGRVKICNLSEKVLKVLKISRLDTVLEIYETEQEALARISAERGAAQPAAADEAL